MSSSDYLRNCWYGFAWAEELSAGTTLSRRILDMPIVAFRGRANEVIALADRCPHRFAPLSRGKVEDGVLRCQYHGLAYDSTGKCIDSPFGAPPVGAAVRSFPIVERDNMLWIWPGDPAAADPTTIPDYSFHTPSDEKDWLIFGYSYVATNYENETDNLMDLSHAEYLHAKTFRLNGAAHRGNLRIHDFGPEIRANLWMPDNPEINLVTGEVTDQTLDRFLDMRWSAPSNLCLKVGFLNAGQYAHRSDDLRDDLPGQYSAHIITPETKTTCHYFWSANRPVGAGPFAHYQSREAGLEMFKIAFEIEDKPMLEAVQANMTGDFWAERPVMMRNDMGGLRCRRRLAEMIRAESGVLSELEVEKR